MNNRGQRAQRRRNSQGDLHRAAAHLEEEASNPQVPSFHNQRSRPAFNDSTDDLNQLETLRISDNNSAHSTNSSENLALLINLDEILGNMTATTSLQSTPHPSRLQTPALSETDPGTEIEVRFEDLGTYDIQGVNWNNFAVSREDYRSIRLREYDEFERNRRGGLEVLPEASEHSETLSPLGPMMTFRYMNKADTCHVPHFQLRHLLCAPTIRNVIFPHFQRIKSWNPVSNQSEIILNTGEFGTAFSKTSVIAATPEHVFVGGFSGEVVIKSLREPELPARLKNYSTDPNCITNHLFPLPEQDSLLLACNDHTLRNLDLQTMKMKGLARFSYALNAAEASPSRDLIACVGDSRKLRLIDFKEGREVAHLTGHTDYAFTCSWSPCGRFLASAGQDRTMLIYDSRKLGPPLKRFVSSMAAFRRLCFSPCGGLLAAMEADDFVHLYDVGTFTQCQTIDFFGEVSGIAFDPNGEALYVGCAGMENGGIMEFNRC